MPSRTGLIVALGVLLADQASKLWLLFEADLPYAGPVTVLPVMEFIVVWNRGISYGLFQQHSDAGRWVLIVLSLLACLGLFVWMRRSTSRFLSLSLGLIIGGALGNVIDRVAYGAVFDFVHLHYQSFSWYVFNVADAAIVMGVAGLLIDSLVPETRRLRRRA